MNKRGLGTSSVVVAAFVGPGTVVTCSKTGIDFGYELAWVLVFATVAVFVLQSFTAATGILAGKGLGEALRSDDLNPAFRNVARVLVVLGLWAGCAAFEMGNLTGAAAGVSGVVPASLNAKWPLVGLGVVAGVMLLQPIGLLIRLLSVLVGLMGLVFVATMFVAPIDWPAALRGIFTPTIPSSGKAWVSTIALVGTTVVTYNLFLHASTTREWWRDEPNKRIAWRRELTGMAIFVPLGGIVSLAILLCGAVMQAGVSDAATPTKITASDLPVLIEPIAGSSARYLFGFGLLAAGLTSAITAPLAAAAGISELFGWEKDSSRFRMISMSVLLTGVVCGLAGRNPVEVIIAAQVANGLLLPLIAGFMLYLAIRQKEVNLPKWYTGLGVLITLICGVLGVWTLLKQWNAITG
jgi:NRAMP (natural resistance-associated macrophage protein)-like metal ion transporter